MKQIQIKIHTNGEIETETIGMKGKTCLKYISEIERMADAVTNDSDFTAEYYQTAEESIVAEPGFSSSQGGRIVDFDLEGGE